jgi:hypothetical protein
LKNGAQSAHEPTEAADAGGAVVTAAVRAMGRVIHTFVSRSGKYDLLKLKERGPFMPRFAVATDLAINEYNRKNPSGLLYVDHCVANVELGKMNEWVKWYEEVLGFRLFKTFDDKDIKPVFRRGVSHSSVAVDQDPDQRAAEVSRVRSKNISTGTTTPRAFSIWRCSRATKSIRLGNLAAGESISCAFRTNTTKACGIALARFARAKRK